MMEHSRTNRENLRPLMVLIAVAFMDLLGSAMVFPLIPFYALRLKISPEAIGAIMAQGNKPAMLVDGDASIMMHLNEFDTMMRHKVPLLIVVQNNEMLGAEYYKLEAHKMNAMTSVIPTPDLGAVARGYGGRGVMAKSVEEVRKAAAEWVANPGPMLIDVRIARSVVTLPYRRIHYGLDE
jgi:thiamine pyrophosphate-dependent acetolactate synthase large subunit-like protein